MATGLKLEIYWSTFVIKEKLWWQTLGFPHNGFR